MKSKVWIGLIGLLSLFEAPGAFAVGSVDQVTVQAEGTGGTVNTATAAALTSAIAQVNGAEVASSAVTTEVIATLDTADGSQSASASTVVEAVAQRSKGVVQNYRVVSQAQNSGLWTVAVEATISKYARSAQADRLRMTVLPFRAQRTENAKAGEHFATELTAQLTSSRKFAMLDRAFESERQSEMSLIASGGAPTEELAKLGNRLGTDYMIVGSIDEAGTTTQSTELAGRTLSTSTTHFSVSYRVIDAPTGQIKLADSWTGTQPGGSLGALANKAADAISRQIVDAITPIRVESVVGNELFLGQGGKSIKVGQKYRLLMSGEPIVDSYTKESLGRQELDVGLIEVIDVQSKIARAKVLKSSVDVAQKFPTSTFIVRLQSEASKAAASVAPSKMPKPPVALKTRSDSDW